MASRCIAVKNNGELEWVMGFVKAAFYNVDGGVLSGSITIV